MLSNSKLTEEYIKKNAGQVCLWRFPPLSTLWRNQGTYFSWIYRTILQIESILLVCGYLARQIFLGCAMLRAAL